MGNTLLEATDKYPLKQFDSWTEQKPELSGGKLLFQSKIFHTMSFNLKNQNSNIIMKIYLKESDFDSRNSQAYKEQFEYLKNRFNPIRYPNILPFMTLLNFESNSSQQQGPIPLNFVVVARQQMYQTLGDRFLYKPSLSNQEKQWILCQTLIALHMIHIKEKLFHGAIRASNILLTTSNHVFLSDFANYKPLFIDEENQISNLRFFYKSHENNSTLAPEKFQSLSSKQTILSLQNIPDDLLTSLQSMDIFSLGCLISDLYLDGELPLFTYEQIQKFKGNALDKEAIIKKISDEKVRDLVRLIILEKNYSKRINIEQILKFFLEEVVENKEKLLLIYCLDVALQSNQLAKSDFRVGLIFRMLGQIHKVIIKKESVEEVQQKINQFKFQLPLCIQSIDFIQKFQDSIYNLNFEVWKLFGYTEIPFYLETHEIISLSHIVIEKNDNLEDKEFKLSQNLFNQYKQSTSNNSSSKKNENSDQSKRINFNREQDEIPELKIIVMLLCTNLRTVQFVATKLVGLEVLVHLSQYLSDKDVLHIILPFICDQLEDFELQVSQYAFESFCLLLQRLKEPFENVNDTVLYKVFIWTTFQKCAKNLEIRRPFIINCIELAKSCIYLNNLSIQKKQQFIYDQFSISTSNAITHSTVISLKNEASSSEKQETEIINVVKEVFKRCLSDCPVDIANLAIAQLPSFFSMLKEDNDRSDFISLYISCLNKPDRKFSCLENMFDIIRQVSDKNQRTFTLLCLKDCIADENELFSYTALKCTWKLVENEILKGDQIYEFVEQIAPIILHPHGWVRKEAIKFLEIVIIKMDPIEVFIEIQPRVIKYMVEDVAVLTKDILHLILPEKINKDNIDFQSKKCVLPEKLGDQMIRRHLLLFQNNYLEALKSTRDHIKAEKDEEIRQFNYKLEQITSRQLHRQGFSKKIVTFLASAYNQHQISFIFKELICIQNRFRHNMFFYLNLANEIYKINTSLEDKQLDKLMIEFLREQKIVPEQNGYVIDLNNELVKLLNQMQLKLQINYDSCMTNHGLYSNHFHKNFASALVTINEYIFKLKQFEVSEEIDVGKPFFSDNGSTAASGQSSTNSLKVWHPQGQIVTTLYEHSDLVSCLESVQNNRHFLSGSYDGTVRIYDIANLEQDFTSDSMAQIICNEGKEGPEGEERHKIKCLKMIPDSSSLLVGSEKGSIFLYNIDKLTDQKQTSDQRKKSVQTFNGSGEVRCLECFKNDSDKFFLYATSKGEVGIRDIRQKTIALSNNIGKERGLISSMVLAPGFSSYTTSTAVIGTLNGYCLMYDLRCNLLSHNYMLMNASQEQALPIMNLSNFYRYSNIDILEKQNDLLAMSFVSDNHEVAMFNLNQVADTLNPSLYMLSTKNYNPTFQTPILKKLNKEETQNYYNRNTLKDMMEYDFIPKFAHQVNALDYLSDPLIKMQNSMKRLEQSQNSFKNIQSVHSCQNYVSKIICLPSFSSDSVLSLPKVTQNSILTCGNDKNIRLWPMISDPPSKSNYQIDTQIKGYHISNTDKHQRNFSQKKADNVLVLHEYSRDSFHQSPIYAQAAKKKSQLEELNYSTFNLTEKQSAHADTITDMIYVEREQGALLISSSRDKTIKIWK